MTQARRRILFLVTDETFSYHNTNSAVANYINGLMAGIESENISTHGYPKNKALIQSNTAQKSRAKGSMLKKALRTLSPASYYSVLVKKKTQYADELASEILSNDEHFDLVIEFLTVGSCVAYHLKKKRGIPYIIICDSPLLEQFEDMYGTKSFLKRRIETREMVSLENADAIVCYSQSVEAYLRNKFILKGRVYILPSVVWKEEIVSGLPKNDVIGFIGSFLKWHRVDLLLSAFEKIADEFPKARLILVGYGQEWKRISDRVKKSSLAGRITLTGYVNEEELTSYKKQFKIGVMAGSNWYGSPLKLFEYAQSSIAIIAPETPVVCDLFTKDEVLFIDKNNSLESLVYNLRLLLTDEVVAAKMIEKAHQKMSGSFSKREQMGKWNELIANILQGGIKD